MWRNSRSGVERREESGGLGQAWEENRRPSLVVRVRQHTVAAAAVAAIAKNLSLSPLLSSIRRRKRNRRSCCRNQEARGGEYD